jgi:hypothetical protein
LEDHLSQVRSLAEHDGMNCIALLRSGDQTLDHLQQAEPLLETEPLESPQRRDMEVSSSAW